MKPPVLPAVLDHHPRGIAAPGDFLAIRARIASDPVSARIFRSLKTKSDQFLALPPLERIMTGRRLLEISRIALERVSTLAMVARITGEPRYVRRAAREMLAISAFTDWNPSHFLDVAEMAAALAIGYDWLYDDLTSEERDTIATALVDFAIRPSFEDTPDNVWITRENNWNQVCHASLSLAAIAVADREPVLAETILRRAVDHLPLAGVGYAPDGAYPEGPMYWNYGTSYHVLLIAALRRLTGDTFGLERFPGFLESAAYMVHTTTPSGEYFCYSDCRPVREFAIPLFWFAKELRSPRLLANDLGKLDEYLDAYDPRETLDHYRILAFALLWRDPALDDLPAATFPRHWMGRGPTPVAIFRSAWDDPRALFVTLKGGSLMAGHAQMDIGSFLLDLHGVRWAEDLGMQEYESLESQGLKIFGREQSSTRWTIFRLGPESHNVLRFDNGHQLVGGKADFTLFRGEEEPRAVLDLAPIYGDAVRAVHRGLRLLGDDAVLIQDEWTLGDRPAEVVWQMLTKADVQPGESSFQLSRNGETLHFTIQATHPLTLEVQDANTLLQSYDEPNPGLKRIRILQSIPAQGEGTLRVVASPGKATDFPTIPLSDW